MDAVRSRLLAVKPEKEKIMSISGLVGLSYGVVYRGQLAHIENIGLRDLEQNFPVDEETMFPICSMTKNLISSILGMLVEEGTLAFDDYVTSVLPAFDPIDKSFKNGSRLSDWLSMQSGTQGYQCWVQSENNIVIEKNDAMKLINNLVVKADPRTEFTYNNWGYELAGQVIKHLTGENWDEHVRHRILEPLHLKRTTAAANVNEFDNIANLYMTLDNAIPFKIPQTTISADTLGGAAGGVRSCMKDLLVLYQAVLDACIDQFHTGCSSTKGSVFKNLTKTMSAHNQLPGHSLRELSYGFGWIRTQLPNQMGRISSNLDLLGDHPILGEDAQPILIISHGGGMPGASCGVSLFPESNSFLVLLSNSTPMCDSADWITQLLTQTLFDFPKKHDYVGWVQKTVDAERAWYPKVSKELEAARQKNTKAKELSAYAGNFMNNAGFFLITVRVAHGKLFMAFQDREDEVFELRHYENDTFCWLMPRNELAKRARMFMQPANYYLIKFFTGDQGKVDGLRWVHDPSVPEGETFVRKSP